MTNWKPGQKLEGPNGERAIWLGDDAKCHNVVIESDYGWFLTRSGTWHHWTPVDDWSDPVAEARERIAMGVLVDVHPMPYTVLDRILRECAADLRVLLDAEEAKSE